MYFWLLNVYLFSFDNSVFKVVPGETALAFFTAANPTNDAITGISTYNVVPFEVSFHQNLKLESVYKVSSYTILDLLLEWIEVVLFIVGGEAQ